MRMKTLLQSSALCIALGFSFSMSIDSAQDPAQALADIGKTVLSLGPNGEKPEAASTVTLTDEELAELEAE